VTTVLTTSQGLVSSDILPYKGWGVKSWPAMRMTTDLRRRVHCTRFSAHTTYDINDCSSLYFRRAFV